MNNESRLSTFQLEYIAERVARDIRKTRLNDEQYSVEHLINLLKETVLWRLERELNL